MGLAGATAGLVPSLVRECVVFHVQTAGLATSGLPGQHPPFRPHVESDPGGLRRQVGPCVNGLALSEAKLLEFAGYFGAKRSGASCPCQNPVLGCRLLLDHRLTSCAEVSLLGCCSQLGGVHEGGGGVARDGRARVVGPLWQRTALGTAATAAGTAGQLCIFSCNGEEVSGVFPPPSWGSPIVLGVTLPMLGLVAGAGRI